MLERTIVAVELVQTARGKRPYLVALNCLKQEALTKPTGPYLSILKAV